LAVEDLTSVVEEEEEEEEVLELEGLALLTIFGAVTIPYPFHDANIQLNVGLAMVVEWTSRP
jgi:hypothetical protein